MIKTTMLMIATIAVFGFAAGIFSILPVEAAAEGLVTVTPSQAFVGEEITVTLEGFRSNSRIVAGNVSLGDLRLPVPGYLNYPGSQPVTDSHGWVTFSSHVPRQVAIGPQKVVVDWGQETERTTTFTVLSASLAVTPQKAVANQTVVIRGNGFTPSTVVGGKGPMRVHQITGTGRSFVTLAGMKLGPYVPYPINLNTDGSLHTTVTLPLVEATVGARELEFVLTDTNGRSG